MSVDSKFTLTPSLTVDGKIGKQSIAAIKSFQEKVVSLSTSDGRVDPNGKTLGKLKEKLKKELTEDALIAIMSHGNSGTIKTFLPCEN